MGFVRMKALLPCLLPKTPENAAEFEKNVLGSSIIITVTLADKNALTGDALLAARMKDAQSYREITGRGPSNLWTQHYDVGGFEIFDYEGLLKDIFLLRDSHPTFFIECSRLNQVPFPHCFGRGLIHNHLLIEYEYSRTWIEGNLQTAESIDKNVRTLIARLASPETENSQLIQGVCQ
jgi:hypothetical protein